VNTTEPVNILLVDDQPAKLLSYEVILRELGQNLIKANSAREAFEHLLKTEIAVVLVDVCMPDLDGFELAAMIREHPRFQKMAIIFVSAIHMSDIDRIKGYESGAVDYVPVPVVPEVLRAKVRIFIELYTKTRKLERWNAELEQRIAERTRAHEVAQAQLHEMQKMESLGQLTGGVAHDFNNLLMVVIANLELLRKRLPEDPRLLCLLDGAMKGAHRGTILTKRLLAFARRQQLKPEIIEIPTLIGGMIEMLSRSIGPTIRIITDFQSDLPSLLVDPSQLELAVLNLALNARDAMGNGGILTISAQRRIIAEPVQDCLVPGDYVCLSVSDTGTGMDELTLKRAIEPFFTTKGTGKGTGLGLSMVHGLAAQSGGVLKIQSCPGIGSTMEIWLPVTERELADEVLSPPVRHEIRSCGVLVVDDDALVLAGTSAMLEDLGHSVIEACSGVRAVEMLCAGAQIDVVITDYAMPEMSGVELAQRIAQIRSDLPIILATGYAELKDEIPRSMPVLNKPYQQRELAAQIAKVLEGRRTMEVIPVGAEQRA
jgi:signal transduction histidine kinase